MERNITLINKTRYDTEDLLALWKKAWAVALEEHIRAEKESRDSAKARGVKSWAGTDKEIEDRISSYSRSFELLVRTGKGTCDDEELDPAICYQGRTHCSITIVPPKLLLKCSEPIEVVALSGKRVPESALLSIVRVMLVVTGHCQRHTNLASVLAAKVVKGMQLRINKREDAAGKLQARQKAAQERLKNWQRSTADREKRIEMEKVYLERERKYLSRATEEYAEAFGLPLVEVPDLTKGVT